METDARIQSLVTRCRELEAMLAAVTEQFGVEKDGGKVIRINSNQVAAHADALRNCDEVVDRFVEDPATGEMTFHLRNLRAPVA